MRYSDIIGPRDRRYVKGYGFLSFAKNMGKSLSNKYSQKLFDSAKKSTTVAIKTASKRAIQKIEEATGDMIGNKIADKITSISKKPSNNNNNNNNNEYVNFKKIHISQRNATNYWQIKSYCNSVIMEYQKIADLLNDESNKPSKFMTRNWVEINDDIRGVYSPNK